MLIDDNMRKLTIAQAFTLLTRLQRMGFES